jgi:hypothetical protein
LELPLGYTTIPNILAHGVASTVYTTRGVVVGINGGSIFLEDPATQQALNVYESPAVLKDTLLIGNVVDVTGTYKIYNQAAELDAATVTLYEAEADPAVEPVVIADGAALTARMGTDTSLSGQLIRLNDVTVGPWEPPLLTTTSSPSTVLPLLVIILSLAYEINGTTPPPESTGRTAINTLIGQLNTSGETFDIMGVLYHSSNTLGTWKLGLCTVDYVIPPQPPNLGSLEVTRLQSKQIDTRVAMKIAALLLFVKPYANRQNRRKNKILNIKRADFVDNRLKTL